MRNEKLDLSNFPLGLNTEHNIGELLPNEVTSNYNVIKMPSGDLSTHPNFGYKVIDGTTAVLRTVYVSSVYLESQYIIYALYDDGNGNTKGKLCSVKATNLNKQPIPATVLMDDMTPYAVPSICPYLLGVYIIIPGKTVQYYDGTTLEDKTDLPSSLCAMVMRGRLWFGGVLGAPGTLEMTQIDKEDLDGESFHVLGDNQEPITALLAIGADVYAFKQHDYYTVSWDDDLTGAIVRHKSSQAGSGFQTTVTTDLVNAYMLNPQGLYISTKENVSTSGRELYIEPGTIYLSEPIRNTIDNYQTYNIGLDVYYKGGFEDDDFAEMSNIVVDEQNSNGIRLDLDYDVIHSYTSYDQSGIWWDSDREEGDYSYQTFTVPEEMFFAQFYNYFYVDELVGNPDRQYKMRLYDGFLDEYLIEGDSVNIGTINVSHGDQKAEILVPAEEVLDYPLYPSRSYRVDVVKDTAVELRLMFEWLHDGDYEDGIAGTSWGWPVGSDKSFLLGCRKFESSGYVISEEIERPNTYKWGAFNVTEDQEDDDVSITYYLRARDEGGSWTDWTEVEPGHAVPEALAYYTNMQWKAEMATESNIKSPWIYAVTLTSYSLGFDGYSSLSSYDNKVYILGVDDTDTPLNLVYDPRAGFLQLDNINVIPWELHGFRNIAGTRFCGGGSHYNTGTGEYDGVLLYEYDTEDSEYMDNPIEVFTGKMLLGETPRKVRQLFLTYMGTGVNIAVVTDGFQKTFTLDDVDDFTVKEINLATPRTKWIRLKIWSTSGFKMKKDIFVGIKSYKQNE